MGRKITITSADSFELEAYYAEPENKALGGIVVVQEIFGVNSHIREVTDGYARAGYCALAPAIFDRVERGVELGYDEQGMTRGIELARGQLDIQQTLADIQAAVSYLQPAGRVGAVGYCFGGLLAYLSACQVSGLAAAVGYYGGGIVGVLDQSPQIPLMLHFGELDARIPMSDVDQIKSARPDVIVHTYDADHGFNCDHRPSYNAAAADLARQRSLAFFNSHLQD